MQRFSWSWKRSKNVEEQRYGSTGVSSFQISVALERGEKGQKYLILSPAPSLCRSATFFSRQPTESWLWWQSSRASNYGISDCRRGQQDEKNHCRSNLMGINGSSAKNFSTCKGANDILVKSHHRALMFSTVHEYGWFLQQNLSIRTYILSSSLVCDNGKPS